MSALNSPASPDTAALTNGAGAAAILSAGISSFALAVLAFAGDKSTSFRSRMIFYQPTGALSGVTTVAILLWLVSWGFLAWCWRGRTVALGRINVIAFVLLGLGFLLTFPPFVDLF